MSLINDALKKAQKQRTGEAPSLGSMPSVGGQSAASISRSGKSSGNPLLIPAGIGAGVLVLAIGGYFAFSGKSAPSSPLPAPSSAQTQPSSPNVGSPLVGGPSSAPSSPLPAPSPAQPSTAAPTSPAFTLQAAPKSEPLVPAPVQATASIPQASHPTPQASVAQASEPAKPVLKLEPRAMTFIENIKVAGIRASATDSKVLMNDRVYRIGDIVEHEMALKLVGITSNSLTFEDERGGRFTRTF